MRETLPLRLPDRGFVPGMTAALWAMLAASAGVDLMLRGGGADRLLGHFLAAGLGVAMCLGLARLFRARPPGAFIANVGLLIFACSLLGIVWAVLARALLFPLARLVTGSASPGPPVSAFTGWLVFLAWAGAWLAVAHAERLRGAARDLEVGRARIVELEALLAGEQRTAEHLWVPSRAGLVRLAVRDLALLRAERDYVRLRAVDGREFLVRATLRQLLGRLGPADFLQVHRSAVVNIRRIETLRRVGRGALLQLEGGAEAVLSRRFSAALRRLEAERG